VQSKRERVWVVDVRCKDSSDICEIGSNINSPADDLLFSTCVSVFLSASVSDVPSRDSRGFFDEYIVLTRRPVIPLFDDFTYFIVPLRTVAAVLEDLSFADDCGFDNSFFKIFATSDDVRETCFVIAAAYNLDAEADVRTADDCFVGDTVWDVVSPLVTLTSDIGLLDLITGLSEMPFLCIPCRMDGFEARADADIVTIIGSVLTTEDWLAFGLIFE